MPASLNTTVTVQPAQISQAVSDGFAVTNTGTVPVYLGSDTNVSLINCYTLNVGATVQWAPKTQLWAIAAPGVPGLIATATEVSYVSDPNAIASQVALISAPAIAAAIAAIGAGQANFSRLVDTRTITAASFTYTIPIKPTDNSLQLQMPTVGPSIVKVYQGGTSQDFRAASTAWFVNSMGPLVWNIPIRSSANVAGFMTITVLGASGPSPFTISVLASTETVPESCYDLTWIYPNAALFTSPEWSNGAEGLFFSSVGLGAGIPSTWTTTTFQGNVTFNIQTSTAIINVATILAYSAEVNNSFVFQKRLIIGTTLGANSQLSVTVPCNRTCLQLQMTSNAGGGCNVTATINI